MPGRDDSGRRGLPLQTETERGVAEASSAAEIAAFLRRARTTAPGEQGRLMFALDATMSRQPTWDRACELQAEMFAEAAALGGLAVQLVYYRGVGECRSSRWVADGKTLASLMGRIDCRGGHTQIVRVLQHARKEALRSRVRALVFVGDAMEEKLDDLCAAAGELALAGCPVLAFQEGRDRVAEKAFREMARITGGAWCRFDLSAAAELRELLRAAAAYAAGGRAALEDLAGRSGSAAPLLLHQLR
jgi:hypothetical protein